MRWTEEQLRAIEMRGRNVLLSAAAGSGKTTVLVARVLKLIEEGVPVDRMLIVTFTRAASADMRAKLQQELGRRAAEGDATMRRQQLLLERASISTLHSFCADFLRTHFECANVDPAFRVLDDAEARRLTDDALDEAIEEFYTDPNEDALLLDYARGPKGVREMASLLLRALDERPDPQAWLDAVCHPGEEMRGAWIDEMLGDAYRAVDRARLYSMLAMRHADCTTSYSEALQKDLKALERIRALDNYDDLQRAVLEFKQARPSTKRGEAPGEEVKSLRDQAGKAMTKIALRDLPLHTALKDMDALAPEFQALGKIAMRARELFAARRAELGALTYTDLEHQTLQALMDPETAQTVREQYDCVFVDEYQDTSDVQEALIGRIVRGDNLFMVGDVKQSIYRFRQAEPRLFLEKYERYARGDGGALLPLTRNFRSRPGILDFVNRVFEHAMRGGDSEIVYDELARLNPGSEDLTGGSAELHLFPKPSEENDEAVLEMKTCEREAMFIAAKIQELMRENPSLRFRDFAVLTRTKQGVLGKMAAVLMQAGIPAFADGAEAFYDSVEVSLALSLLKLVANRRSDVEWIGVLRSPLIGLTDEELARIRVASPEAPFADAVAAYAMTDDEIGRRLRTFLDLYESWRLMAANTDLGVLCRRVFEESGLNDCAGALPGGTQRQANLRVLAENAAQFDANISGSLIRFLRHTEKLQAQEDGGDAQLLGENDDVVRLMTVHKSKGLEFPIVFGAMLARNFSAQKRQASLTAHRTLGLGCVYCDPRLQTRRRTLAQAAIAAREKREDRAEELRILYVLLTRAKDRLILTASEKNLDAVRMRAAALRRAPGAANSALDVILAALKTDGDPLCTVVTHEGYDFVVSVPEDAPRSEEAVSDPALEAALLWKYPDARAAGQPLKLTVTGILRQVQSPDALEPLIERPAFLAEAPKQMRGAERGTAYHRAMQCVDFAPLRELNPRAMTAEIARQLDALAESGRITAQQREAIAPSVIAGFLSRETGTRLRASREVHREWPFNVLMRIAEALTAEEAAGYADEEILVQGTIDCCFMEDDGWILLDYKTDRSSDAQALTARYGDQLRLYALALERITGVRVAEIRLCLLASGEEILIETGKNESQK